jgi:rfaE bifunctional protein kinase chain/domain
MSIDLRQNPLQVAIQEIRHKAVNAKRIVFVSGNFNVIHPGHLRLLNFAAECGDFLVVGVFQDDSADAFVPGTLRLEGVRSISCVDFAFSLTAPLEQLILELKPALVVKGKEHENHFNPEQAAVESYGGRLLFSSGEARFSSMDLLQRELRESNLSSIQKPGEFPQRHGFNMATLAHILTQFESLKVVVIGDLIVDEYITCDPLGMSQEDPTIVVTPIKRDLFVGGAAIVAAHANRLGASVSYYGVVGDDQAALFAKDTLREYGVRTNLITDNSRPTTLKQRYRARGKTLLRVSHLRQHDISLGLANNLLEHLDRDLVDANLLVFSDFNYGCLPQSLVDKIIERCIHRQIPMVADSQSSSQVGDIARFKGMLLLTPTEHEARLAVRDSGSGLVVLAEELRSKASAEHVFVTLGAEGVLIHSPDGFPRGLITDQLPAFNTAPKDVAGAGDCLLICTSMALASGASIWESAYLGSIAAACQVGRVGNSPLAAEEVLQELML